MADPDADNPGGIAAADVATPAPLARWQGCTATELAAAWGVPEVHLFARLGSTSDVARSLAEAGAPSWTVVVAEEQRAGRGRAGRHWASPPGMGLWVSLVLRPETWVEPFRLPLATALAVATALERWSGREVVRIKWPNDLLLRDRKVGGILCEGAWSEGQLAYVVVGIGLNLLHAPDDFPPELRHSATSLQAFSDRSVDRLEVADAVITSLLAMSNTAAGEVWTRDIARRDALQGRWVEVLEPETGRVLGAGTADGIAPNGALRLITPGGLQEVRSGSIRLTGDPA